jgi:hypothetical protein
MSTLETYLSTIGYFLVTTLLFFITTWFWINSKIVFKQELNKTTASIFYIK